LQGFIVANSSTTLEIAGSLAEGIGAGDAYAIVDYHLDAESAAIDRANAERALPFDIEGRPRPTDVRDVGAESTGTEYDIGAYEARSAAKAPSSVWILY
jgi:hypothetical protein